MYKGCLYLFLLIIVLSSCKKNKNTVAPVIPPTIATEWSKSFNPGYLDNLRKFAGGNEIMQIVSHKGKLYAGNSYWMEPDINKRSAEILRLDNSTSKWQVDKEFTNENLRVGVMKSFIFTTNSIGENIKYDTLLIVIPNNNLGNLQQYLRNDISNSWIVTNIASLGNDINCRAMGLHKDAINNKTYIFAGLMGNGVFSGTYNSNLPSKIQWNTIPELIPPPTERVMGFTECNNQIYCATSDGGLAHIYKRNDGLSTWTLVKTFSGAGSSEDLRGLSAVPKINGNGQDLWMFWNNEILRLDPYNLFSQTIELNVATFLTSKLGAQIKYVIAGYNDNIPVINSEKVGEEIRAIGFEMRYDPSAIAQNPSLSHLDRWATDGLYLERKQAGNSINYNLKTIVDSKGSLKDTLIATRSIVVSPFKEDNGRVLFAGGYDCNGIPSSNAAWIYRKNQ